MELDNCDENIKIHYRNDGTIEVKITDTDVNITDLRSEEDSDSEEDADGDRDGADQSEGDSNWDKIRTILAIFVIIFAFIAYFFEATSIVPLATSCIGAFLGVILSDRLASIL